MAGNRPIVLSIAGFDPCGGAGILADIKTFEQHGVYGLAIITAQTLQTEDECFSVEWVPVNEIMLGIEKMISRYAVSAVKLGIVENLEVLGKIVTFIHSKNAAIKIIIDTVIKSSSGFTFWKNTGGPGIWKDILVKATLLTPNFIEVVEIMPFYPAMEAAQLLADHCSVLLKGGHNQLEPGVDYLFTKQGMKRLPGCEGSFHPKHGSGCVLSAAITASLAKGECLENACIKAKQYTEQFLSSNRTLLGYHYA